MFWRKKRAVVPVVRLSGVIASGGGLRRGISLEAVEPQLKKAFSIRRAKAVALIINSPGGSPVQSALIGQRVRDLARKADVPVLAFCEDVAASGGYWLAASADEIYANAASIIGSIGVVSAGFGFDRAIEKLGVDRRVYTAGERKMILDPFRPEAEEDVARLGSSGQLIPADEQVRGELEAGELDAATASMAKWWGSQTQNEVMHECLQLHGGYGFMMEYPIARLYADSRVQMIYGGTNEIMKELIARSLDV